MEKKFSEIQVGDEAKFQVEITDAMIDSFAELSGDKNPLHVDRAYAAATQFGKRVAHGMIGGALFSQLIGMHLPGKYSLYLSQSLTFKKPMFSGMTVEVSGKVVKTVPAMQAVEIETTITGVTSGERLVQGTALVKLLE